MFQFNSICTLKQKTKNVKVGNETVQVTKCDVTGSRKKVKLGEYYQDHPDLLMDDKEYSMSQQAPSLSGNVGEISMDLLERKPVQPLKILTSQLS